MIVRVAVMALLIVAIIYIFGIVFNVLFKIGILLLLFAGVIYLVKKILD